MKDDTFEQIAMVMEKALHAIVINLQCEKETTMQRLQDVRMRIAVMEKLQHEASEARMKANRERKA